MNKKMIIGVCMMLLLVGSVSAIGMKDIEDAADRLSKAWQGLTGEPVDKRAKLEADILKAMYVTGIEMIDKVNSLQKDKYPYLKSRTQDPKWANFYTDKQNKLKYLHAYFEKIEQAANKKGGEYVYETLREDAKKLKEELKIRMDKFDEFVAGDKGDNDKGEYDGFWDGYVNNDDLTESQYNIETRDDEDAKEVLEGVMTNEEKKEADKWFYEKAYDAFKSSPVKVGLAGTGIGMVAMLFLLGLGKFAGWKHVIVPAVKIVLAFVLYGVISYYQLWAIVTAIALLGVLGSIGYFTAQSGLGATWPSALRWIAKIFGGIGNTLILIGKILWTIFFWGHS